MKSRVLFAALPGLLAPAFAADIGTRFFETRIRPVLVDHCHECHSTGSGKSKGGLRVDSLPSLLQGGESGPAIVAGQPEKSLLLAAVKHTDPDREMPPKKPRLPEATIADLEIWIKAGAPWPETDAPVASSLPATQAGDHWSYLKPVPHPPPAVTDQAWPLGSIDRFILARLEQNHLAPSPDADNRTLVRRLYFDLIGLPPTPEQAAAFSLETLEQTVDDLLASPEFGVRWGRHWLDVARFAESNGRESNLTFPHAWRYRDYVIDAFNADIPYNRFLTEQVAGDLLPAATDAERARLTIATGFLALGPKGLNEMNKVQFYADLFDEQVDTVSRAFLASSLACARCHDHKTEPFTMTDYYAFAGIFRSTKTHFGTWIDSENNNRSDLITLPRLPGELIPNKPIPPPKLAEMKAQLAGLLEEEKAMKSPGKSPMMAGKDPENAYFNAIANALRILWTKGGLEGRLATVDEKGNPLPLAMGVSEADRIQESYLLERGDIQKPVRKIPRAFPSALPVPDGLTIPENQSGRLELASWLTDPGNPLTARVAVNRIWVKLFGTGLVRTADNFGPSGEPPSHPELFDHLALTFIEQGWSVKQMIRTIVLSHAYHQASGWRGDAFAADPDNRLIWRMDKRRLDAEVIRDSMLLVTGQLDRSRRPGSLVAELDGQSISLIGFNDKLPVDLDGSRQRSVYLPVIRDNLPDAMEMFDAANPGLVTGDRDVTNVPLQALYLLNGPFVWKQSVAMAGKLARSASTLPEQITLAFQWCFNRNPDETEQQAVKDFFSKSREPEETTLAAFCQSLLSSAEFRNAD